MNGNIQRTMRLKTNFVAGESDMMLRLVISRESRVPGIGINSVYLLRLQLVVFQEMKFQEVKTRSLS